MPQDRPNLILDERSFEGLLSAAFTIQEHNDRRKRAELNKTAKAPTSVCRHCGAPKSAAGSRCGTCGQDEFRPGERLQRNWATMWSESKSQEQSEERSEEQSKRQGEGTAEDPNRVLSEAVGEFHSEAHSGEPQSEDGPTYATRAPTRSAFSLPDPPLDLSVEDIEHSLPHPFRSEDVAENIAGHESAAYDPASASAPSEIDTNGLDSEAYYHEPPPTDTALVHSAFRLEPESEHDQVDRFDFDLEPRFEELEHDTSHTSVASLEQRLSDLRVKLRFRRADLYLGVAVFVAAVALLWPSAVPRRPSSLTAWERALVMIGIAEAPAPVVHLQGDPGVSVWVDPHTALYYCDGDEQYQHTPDGRLSSQHDAQLDRFEPASRTPCE